MGERGSPSSQLRSGQFSDWDVYRFGLSVGIRTLPVNPFEGFKRVIFPIEYVRCAETRYVLQHLDAVEGERILDIGSPKLLSLFLAAKVRATVHATDLLDYFFPAYAAHSRCMLPKDRQRYVMETQDAQAMTYADATFDRVFSISAIEHIPNEGDSASMREIARVLKPGGRCCLTVPWSDKGYEEVFKHRDDPDAYWTASNEEFVFYQRRYDGESLKRRLIESSGLDVVDISFWGERRIPMERMILGRKLPLALRWVLLPAHFPLSRIFLSKLTAEEPSRKKVACVTLQKPSR
jgi:SAM-dependent methyltransferase